MPIANARPVSGKTQEHTHNSKNIIFDLGAVMVEWSPQRIAQNFTLDKNLQHAIINDLFNHPVWISFDTGKISEAELIQQASQQLALTIKQVYSLIEQAKASLHAKHDMVALLKQAKSHGLRTFCLSNLSHEWFAYLSQRHHFFTLFDGKVISAQEGIGKPDPQIYQCLLQRYNINAHNTLFIDDRLENTQAAIQLGMNSITFEHSTDNLKQIKHFILNQKNNF